MTINITNFLAERKDAWVQKQLKAGKDIAEIEKEANEKFSVSHWLPDAAKRAKQLSIASHPSTFSHPGAKTSGVIANKRYLADGYLRSGNVEYPLDVLGNAAALDVYKFLSLPLSNNKTVLSNLEEETDLIKTILTELKLDFSQLKQDFLQIKVVDVKEKTNDLVKQVYFPVGDAQYHLLSLLTPSGLITVLKQRIDAMRFSEETKQAKECRRRNEPHAEGYADIYDLTVTAYGGANSQNISVLNKRNNGRAYLLRCVPPVFEKRHIRYPRQDFLNNAYTAKI